jgi:hypothetical protein
VNMYNHANPGIILLAKEYESACTLHIRTFGSAKLMSRTAVPWYITLYSICTLVLHVRMCATVPTAFQWPSDGRNMLEF